MNKWTESELEASVDELMLARRAEIALDAGLLCGDGVAVVTVEVAKASTVRWTGGTLDAAVRRFVEEALVAHGGNVMATAKALGVSRTTLYRHMI